MLKNDDPTKPFMHLPQWKHFKKLPGSYAPVFDRARELKLLKGMAHLESNQWKSSDDILSFQSKKLQQLALHAFKTTKFYQKQFNDLEIDPTDPDFFEKYWHKIPLLKRTGIQSNSEDLIADQLPKGIQATSWVSTSGSTGEPVKVLKTNLNGFFHSLIAVRECFWAGRDFSKSLGVIRAFDNPARPPYGKRGRIWGGVISELFDTGPTARLDIDTNIAVQMEWLLKLKPTYLVIYPSCLKQLVLLSKSENIDMSFIEQIGTLGEILHPSVRELVKNEWGLKISDCYSSQEMGYMALQCPEHDHLHVQAENVFLEVLDENNKPCEPGQFGRIVVTNLHSLAMPILRYEIGDWAEVGETCPCGRGLPVLNRINGRERNMLKLKDGNTRWPLVGFKLFRSIAPIQRYQIVQQNYDDLLVKLICEENMTIDQENQLAELICSALGAKFNITYEYLEAFPQKKNGKFEEFISF